jgi:phthalate 4,5-dioxygenase oxygenase subunit
MLAREENELLCRVGNRTPMGQMMRRYWLPAVMSDELVADGAPKRVRLLGEDLVAFRDSRGAVGLLDEHCPHRGASLVLARNGDCGLRCLYHGWKFDVAGTVLETPPEPEEAGFKHRIRAPAYPVRESGGIVWAYLGPAGHEPPPMDFDWTALPASHRLIVKARIACNWVQPVEGVIDSAHANVLHADTFKPVAAAGESVYRADLIVDRPSNDKRPRLDVEDAPYGFRYAAIRTPIVDPERQQYIRVTTFIAPIYSMFAAPKGWGSTQMFVPMDDENTMLYFVKYCYERPIEEEARPMHHAWSGMRPGIDLDAEFRSTRNRDNHWLQDRAAMQRGESFSGITGVQNEDAVVQESMGRLYDRTKEHLGTSDIAVIRMRRLMLDSVRRFSEGGEPPLGLREPVDYSRIVADERMIPLGAAWQHLCPPTPSPTPR